MKNERISPVQTTETIRLDTEEGRLRRAPPRGAKGDHEGSSGIAQQTKAEWFQARSRKGSLAAAFLRTSSPLHGTSGQQAWRYVGLLFPFRLLWWTVTLQLSKRLQLHRDYELVTQSGIFDASFYLGQIRDVAHCVSDPLHHYLTRGGFEGRDPHPLFDSDWYLDQNPDVSAATTNPLLHYIRQGWKEGRNPHPLFDSRGYLQRNRNVAAAGVNPLSHYLSRGWKEGCNPHPLFDTSFYLEQNPGVAPAGIDPLQYYLTQGGFEARDPHPLFKSGWYLQQNRDAAVAGMNPLLHYLSEGWTKGCNPHPLFDASFYLEQNPDVEAGGINPLLHYVSTGAQRALNPNWLFDSSYYLRSYPDARTSCDTPLGHYVRYGVAQSRRPHPLFDPAFYLTRHSDARASDMDPLSHYLITGSGQHYSPHALFNVDFYLAQNPGIDTSHSDPLRHYLYKNVNNDVDPCELFDASFYLEQYPKVAEAGLNPLVHFLTDGVREHCNPNPLFDTSFYLKQNPDIATSGFNPLVHFVLYGAWEGRLPNPFFDPNFYLRKYSDVKRRRINPLAHYLVLGGAEEGRDPSPLFSTVRYVSAYPDLKDSGVNPLAHFLGYGRERSQISAKPIYGEMTEPSRIALQVANLESRVPSPNPDSFAAQKTILYVTHVVPCRSAVGNEYRMHRLLHWIQSAGYRVLLVLSPLPEDLIDHTKVRQLAAEFGSVIVCERDGKVTYSMHAGGDVVAALHGKLVPQYPNALSETERLTERSLELLSIDQRFCHDALLYAVTQVATEIESRAVLTDNIFMSRLFPLLGPGTLKIVAIWDATFGRQETVDQYDTFNGIRLSSQEQRERLLRANLILAFDSKQQRELWELAAPRTVITVGIDFPTAENQPASNQRRILYVGSDKRKDVRGLEEFLKYAWPPILRSVPDTELVVAGGVCAALKSTPGATKLLGPVDDLAPLYREAKVVINPSIAGPGMIVRTLQALSHFRPIVTWPVGVEGLDARLTALCNVVTDWYEFYQNVITILTDSRQAWMSNDDPNLITECFSQATVYNHLRQELDAFFQHGQFVMRDEQTD